jgi:hypothetical protein
MHLNEAYLYLDIVRHNLTNSIVDGHLEVAHDLGRSWTDVSSQTSIQYSCHALLVRSLVLGWQQGICYCPRRLSKWHTHGENLVEHMWS